MGAYDDLLPEKQNSASAYADLLPKKAKEEGFISRKIREVQQAENSALPGLGDASRAAFHHLGNLPYGLLQTLLNKETVPGRKNTPDFADWINKTISEREQKYQAETPTNAGSVAGATVGALAPYLAGPGKAITTAPFKASAEYLAKALPNAPRTAQTLAGIAGGSAVAPILTQVQPTIVNEGQNFTDEKKNQLINNQLIAIGLPPLLTAGGAAVGKLAGGVGNLANIIDASLIPGGAERAAGRIANKATGNLSDEVRGLLRTARPGETAAQSATPAGSAEFSALESLAQRYSDPSARVALKNAQASGRGDILESAKPNIERVTEIKKNLVPELLKREYRKANLAGEKLPDFIARMEEKYKGQKEYLTQLGKFASLENQSLNSASQAVDGQNKFGWLPKAERHLTNAESYGNAAKEAADLYKGVSGDRAFLSRQAESLSKEGFFPLTTGSLKSKISGILQTPGERDPSSDKLLSTISSELDRYAKINIAERTKGMNAKQAADYVEKFGDTILAQDLHKLRRTGIDNILKPLLEESAPSTKQHLGGLVSSLKQNIDEAITAAGGDKWANALKVNTKLSRAQDQHTVLTELKTQLLPGVKETPQAFLDRIGKNKEEFMAGLNQFQKDPRKLLTTSQNKKLDEVVRQVNRDIQLEELEKAGLSKASRLTHAEEIPTAPGFVDVKITILNKLLNIVEGKGTSQTLKTLSDLTAPGNQARLLKAMENADPVIREQIKRTYGDLVSKSATPLILTTKTNNKDNK